LSITLLIEDAKWRRARGLGPRLKRAARLALGEGGRPPDADLTILLTGDEAVRGLNRAYRGTDQPTDVLSFAAISGTRDYLGDIAIAYGVTSRDAKEAGKSLSDHAIHLAIHGVLHLLGFDHQTARQAKAMEGLESKILTSLSIQDPWDRAA